MNEQKTHEKMFMSLANQHHNEIVYHLQKDSDNQKKKTSAEKDMKKLKPQYVIHITIEQLGDFFKS